MNTLLVYITAILFIISVFPVHVLNYVYVSTESGYASINVTLYRLITVINLNTDKRLKILNKPQNDDKQKKIMTPVNWLKIYNKLCITKIVQLCDIGLLNEENVYLALGQHMLTSAAYAFVKINGGKTKLRNYRIFNYEHGEVNYYLKLEGVINVMSLLRLILTFYWEKIKNERKIKKNSKRRRV